MPRRPLTDAELRRHANTKYFRDVFMRNQLPKKPYYNEDGIVNLDDCTGPGTHWVAYKKRGCKVNYFDSFGNLRPPIEVLNYFKNCKIN